MEKPREQRTNDSTEVPRRVVGLGSCLVCLGLLFLWRARATYVAEWPRLYVFWFVLWLALGSAVVGILVVGVGWRSLRRRKPQECATAAALEGVFCGMAGYLSFLLSSESWIEAATLALLMGLVALVWHRLLRSSVDPKAPDQPLQPAGPAPSDFAKPRSPG